MTTKNFNKIISRNKEVLGGTPVFKGTRVPVKTFFEYLKAGQALDEFHEDFPSVSCEKSISLLDHVEQQLNNVESFSFQELSPITSSLIGILKDSNLKEEDYKHYLKNKYL
ncbi:MAG TPA: DUF433 domain-containing protein [Balneolaceae bacterium]